MMQTILLTSLINLLCDQVQITSPLFFHLPPLHHFFMSHDRDVTCLMTDVSTIINKEQIS